MPELLPTMKLVERFRNVTEIQLPWVELCREGRSGSGRQDTSLEMTRFRLSRSEASRGGDRQHEARSFQQV